MFTSTISSITIERDLWNVKKMASVERNNTFRIKYLKRDTK